MNHGTSPIDRNRDTRLVLEAQRIHAEDTAICAGLDVTLITNSMAASMMARGLVGLVGLVIVGTDRVTSNDDVVNRIGTLGVAVLNPAFDVTPHALVRGLITEHGIIEAPFAQGLRRVAHAAMDASTQAHASAAMKSEPQPAVTTAAARPSKENIR